MYSRTRLDRQPMRVCVEEPKGDRAGKRGPAQQLLVLVAQCLSLVGMRWRLATCGRSHVSASAARRAEQASKQCSPCQVMFDSHPPSPKPTPSSSSLVQLRLPARQTRPQQSGQHLRALPSLDRHLLPYGRMITSTDDQPVLLQSPDSDCHSLSVCIGSYSLASSVRNISDLPSPLGLTHMGLAATRAPRSFNLLVIDVTFKLHPVALSRTTFSIFSVHHLCMSFQRDRTMHSSIGQVTD